jgi:hypothetical protein
MAMSNSVEAVFEFLRKNGLSEAESALRQDIIDKHNNDLASFDYEKFFFPMVPPPPPVKLRSFTRPSELTSGDGQFSKSNSVSSGEQFVSIGSSTSPSRVSSTGTLFISIIDYSLIMVNHFLMINYHFVFLVLVIMLCFFFFTLFSFLLER